MSAQRPADLNRYVWLVAAVFVAAVAFVGGRALGSNEAEDVSYTYDLATPPYVAPATASGVSKGGFTGFGASGIDGETIVSGRVRSVTADSITLETVGGGTEVVRITGTGTLQRIDAALASQLPQGASVVVRSPVDDPDAAISVLVLSEP